MANITNSIERLVALLDEQRTALEAAELMSEKGIGSVVVTSHSQVTGIFTETDLLRRVVVARRDPATTRLEEVMRRDLVTVSPSERCERCIEIMKEQRCRHLLVYDGPAFVGVISLRDLLVLLLDEKEELIRQLTRYIAT